MKRSTILNKIKKNTGKILSLSAENHELERQSLLLSDKNQWYKEAEETIQSTKETALIGRIYWKERFIDESNGSYINIERSRVVRKNGEWIN